MLYKFHEICTEILTTRKCLNICISTPKYAGDKSLTAYLLSPQTAVGKKLRQLKTSHLWNQLPNQLKQIQSPNSFEVQLKNYLPNKIC